jgi:hypothetical protein
LKTTLITRLLGSAVMPLALLLPATAMAGPTTIHFPATTTNAVAGAVGVSFGFGPFGTYSSSCSTVSGGSATSPAAPANYNSNGPVTLPWSTPVQITGCSPTVPASNAIAITTSGAWQQSLNGDNLASNWTIPAGGLVLRYGPPSLNCNGTSETGGPQPAGTWANGVVGFGGAWVRSSFTITGSVRIRWSAGCGPLVNNTTTNLTFTTNTPVTLMGWPGANDSEMPKLRVFNY